MNLTPLDIQQQKFELRFRGFAREEVESFLELVSNEMEQFLRENNTLREDVEKKESAITEYKEREKSINDSIITAQRITEEMKLNAKKEAGLIISEANIQADKIIRNAEQELENAQKQAELITSEAQIQAEKIVYRASQELGDIKKDILNLKKRRLQFGSALRSLVETHQKMLDIDENEIEMDDDELMTPSTTSIALEENPMTLEEE